MCAYCTIIVLKHIKSIILLDIPVDICLNFLQVVLFLCCCTIIMLLMLMMVAPSSILLYELAFLAHCFICGKYAKLCGIKNIIYASNFYSSLVCIFIIFFIFFQLAANSCNKKGQTTAVI